MPTDSATDATGSRRPVVISAALVMAVALAVTLPSIVNGFVYDDVWIIEQNDVVHRFEVAELVQSPYWPRERGGVMWRPLTLVAFSLQWMVGGGQPLLFHAANILLYAFVCGLAFWLCAQLFNWRLGLLAGLLFAVHPVHVEVTANVVGQAELWASLGYLIALLGAWKRSGEPDHAARNRLLVIALGGVAVGLGGKEYVVTFPAALFVLWWLRARQDSRTVREVARREWLALAAGVVMIAGYLVLRSRFAEGLTAAGGIATGLDRDSLISRLVVMLPVTLEWIRLLFLPLRLSADYSPQHLVPQTSFAVNHLLALVVWGTIVWIAWAGRQRWTYVFAGVLLFVITISVVSNVIVPTEVMLAERFLFFPSLGWAIVVGGLLVPVAREGPPLPRRSGLVLIGLLTLALAVRSMDRTTVWRSNDAFFEQLLEDAPDSFRSHWALGWFAFERGDQQTGEREMRTAVRLNPDHPQLLQDLGRRYASADLYEPAIPLLSRAVSLDSSRLASALPLALSLARQGRPDEALGVLDAMAAIHGETRGIAVVRGETLMRKRAFAEAARVLRGLIEQEPLAHTVRGMLAEAAGQLGECRVALAQADTAVSLARGVEKARMEAVRDGLANGNGPCN